MSITRLIITIFVLTTLTHTSQSARSPSPASSPASSSDCSTLVKQAADCVPYINNGSTVATPSNQCCSELRGLVNSEGVCLCEFFLLPQNFGTGFDANRVLNLSAACGLRVNSGVAFQTSDVVCVAGETVSDNSSSASGRTTGVFGMALFVGTATATLLLSMLSGY
ncbi:Non-specific lipid transfer protein GPI-anchored 31-like protein [Drosera capensis]